MRIAESASTQVIISKESLNITGHMPNNLITEARSATRESNSLILEAKLGSNFIQAFKKKYGETLTDEFVKNLATRFENRSQNLDQQDIMQYPDLDSLVQVLQPQQSEYRRLTSLVDGKQILRLKDKHIPQLRHFLRAHYGYQILDEDLDIDILKMFNAALMTGEKELSDLLAMDFHEATKYALSKIQKDDQEAEHGLDHPEADVLLNDGKVLVVKPKTHAASRYYARDIGAATTWCTGHGSSQHWDEYVGKGMEFVYVQSLEDPQKKYAIAYKDEAIEIYDYNNTLASAYMVSREFPGIVPLLKENGVPIKELDEYDVEETEDGYLKIVEKSEGMGGMSGTITSVIHPETGQYREIDENDLENSWGMMIED